MKKTLITLIVLVLMLSAMGAAVAEDALSFAAGSNHSGFITAKGNLYTVGWNKFGQVGIPQPDNDTSIYALTKTTVSVKQVSLGFWHSLSLNLHGNVFAWGKNEFGQVGNGLDDGLDVFEPTHLPQLQNIVEIAAGDEHNLALDAMGNVFSWGRNSRGQLATGNLRTVYEPRLVKAIGGVSHIFAGERNSAFLMADGSVYMVGENASGQLLMDPKIETVTEPTRIPLDNVVTMDIGDFHVAAVTTSGDLYMWGDNTYGQLGLGDEALGMVVASPTLVMQNVKSVALGDYQSFVITNDGQLHAFGRNDMGQLGVGDKEPRTFPTPTLQGVESVRSGFAFGIAKMSDGRLMGWGKGDLGQLCPGAKAMNLSPIVIKAYQ